MTRLVPAAIGWKGPGLIDRYVVRGLAAPAAAALVVMLTALMLYRVLEIMRSLAESGLGLVHAAGMLLDVLPRVSGHRHSGEASSSAWPSPSPP